MPASAPAASLDRRSYAFLVERLLPRHLLSEARRAHLDAALAQSDRLRLYGETVAALAELVAEGILEEMPSLDPGARVYRRAGGLDTFRLEMPRRSAQQASRPNSATAATVADRGSVTQATLAPPDQASTSLRTAPSPAPPEATASRRSAGAPTTAPIESAAGDFEAGLESGLDPHELQAIDEDVSEIAGAEDVPLETPASPEATAPAAAAQTWNSIEPFIELAGIESQLEPFADRLRRIVTQLEHSLPGARARLLCLEADDAEGLGDGAVQILEPATLEEMPHFREALRRGETQFATSAPLGTDPASGRIAAAVPIHVAGEPWGLLQVTWPQGHTGSVAELARLLAPVARLVAIAIQNQTTLQKLVFVDALTGVYNRAFYERQVTMEIERANRTNQKFALLVMDVDDFKPINDRHGHRAGDSVLSQLAREVRGRMRKIDLMFRYGGEEFVLLLPGADLEEAQRTAERLRLVVSEQRFLVENTAAPLRVTVSIGGAVYPDQSRTKTGIFNAADAALYRAKHEGKNRVAF